MSSLPAKAPLVSIVVTSYNRSHLLAQTLRHFVEQTEYPRESLQYIVTDDGSDAAHRREIEKLPFDEFVLSDTNRGLGANLNAGLARAKGKYILYLQDDIQWMGPRDHLQKAVHAMESLPAIGYLRFFCKADPKLEYQRVQLAPDLTVRLYLLHSPANRSLYTDLPHMQSAEFRAFMGPYLESKYSQYSEADMKKRFDRQERFLAAAMEGYDCVKHIGGEESWTKRRPTPRERFGAWRRKITGR